MNKTSKSGRHVGLQVVHFTRARVVEIVLLPAYKLLQFHLYASSGQYSFSAAAHNERKVSGIGARFTRRSTDVFQLLN